MVTSLLGGERHNRVTICGRTERRTDLRYPKLRNQRFESGLEYITGAALQTQNLSICRINTVQKFGNTRMSLLIQSILLKKKISLMEDCIVGKIIMFKH